MKTVYESLDEMRKYYFQTINDALAIISSRYEEETLIGVTSDETLLKVYRADGRKQAIQDVRSLFLKGV